MSFLNRALAATGVAGMLAFAHLPAAADLVTHGYFENVQVTRPAGTPRNFVMWLGNAKEDEALVKQLVDQGSMVAHVDAARFTSKLEVDNGACLSADGALENLSRHIQAYYKLPTYLTPITVGDGAGAALAYGMAQQAQPDAQVGVISMGFCPVFQANKPLCTRDGLDMSARASGGFDIKPGDRQRAPFVALQNPAAGNACGVEPTRSFLAKMPASAVAPVPPERRGPALVAAVASFASRQKLLPPPPSSLADLPLVEIPATPGAPGLAASGAAGLDREAQANRMVILLSGDGGWAEIDKGIAQSFADEGVPVVGVDSLRYFWSERTPDGLAKDIDRVIRYYSAKWNRNQVVLAGFSQGADVLPFTVNRLPPAAKAKVRATALIGLGEKASFEFHVTNWLGPSGDKPIAPEASRLSAHDTLCMQGDKEPNSLCPKLPTTAVTTVLLPGNHHFNGAYALLAQTISRFADKAGPSVSPSATAASAAR